jgi:hypothetical protein
MVTSDFQKLLPLYPRSATLGGVAIVDGNGGTSAAVVQGVPESLGILYGPGGSIATLKATLLFLKSGNPVPTENAPVVFNGRNYRIEQEGIEDVPGLWKINLVQEVA